MKSNNLARPLYEIANDYQLALQELDYIEDTESEEYQNALTKLENIQISVQDKAIAVAAYVKNIEAQREAIDQAIKQMQERKKRLERIVERREDYLQDNMERCGITKINCPYFDITLAKNPPAVDVEDESLVPKDYIVETISTRVDKVKAKGEMLLGVYIPGLKLTQRMKVKIK